MFARARTNGARQSSPSRQGNAGPSRVSLRPLGGQATAKQLPWGPPLRGHAVHPALLGALDGTCPHPGPPPLAGEGDKHTEFDRFREGGPQCSIGRVGLDFTSLSLAECVEQSWLHHSSIGSMHIHPYARRIPMKLSRRTETPLSPSASPSNGRKAAIARSAMARTV